MADSQKEVSGALTFTSQSFDKEAYNGVSTKAKLADLRTLSSSFSVKAECIWDLEKGGENLKHSFKDIAGDFRFDSVGGVAMGTVNWIAEIKAGRKKALKLNAEFLVVYTGLEGQSEDYARLYFSKIARFATYPYFRSLFSNQAASAGVMLPPLPALTDRID